MKRLRVLFAAGLILLFLPIWRLLDYMVILWPGSWLYTFLFTLTLLMLVGIPVYLISSRLKFRWVFLAVMAFGSLNLILKPLSEREPERVTRSHCGHLTYTGFFYPIQPYATSAFSDDLAVRNQLCWVRKLIMTSPTQFRDDQAQVDYLKSLEKLLLEPEEKYLATLPMVAWLYGQIATRMQLSGGEFFVSTLHFWKDHYRTVINGREYSWWDWPLSAVIQWEYGLIENNWEDIIENVSIEEP